MNHVLQALTVYRPYGQPAFGTIQFKTIPNSSDTITIDGTVFTYGVDFSGATTPVRAAQGLTSAIRSDVEYSYINATKQPIRTFTAVYYNDTVFVFATSPGIAGNSITLATSNTGAIALSAATLSGGTASTSPLTVTTTASASALTDGSGTITAGGTAQTIFALNAARKYLAIQNQSSDVLWVNFGVTAVASEPSIQLPANGGSITYESNFVPSGSVSVIGATTGDAFTAKQA